MPRSFKQYVAARTGDKSDAIRAFLKRIGAQYVNQLELCRATGVPFQDLATYREQFPEHIVPTRDRSGAATFLWAGTPRLAKQMRAVTGREVTGK